MIVRMGMIMAVIAFVRMVMRVGVVGCRQPHIGHSQPRQMGEQFPLEGSRDIEGRCDRLLRVGRDRHVRMQLVADPARLRVNDLAYTANMLSRVVDVVEDTGLDAIEHPGQNRPRRLPDDAEDRNCDQQADDRVSERKAEPTPIAPMTTARLVRPSVRA